MRQLSLIREKKYRGRKTARAIATKRGANHVVLKSRVPVLRRHRAIVLRSIRETQDRFEIRLHALAVMEDHIHLLVRVSSRAQFANALRMLAGTIARRIKLRAALGSRSGFGRARGPLWRERAWSRVVRPGRDQLGAIRYVACNPIRAGIWGEGDAFWLWDGVLQL